MMRYTLRYAVLFIIFLVYTGLLAQQNATLSIVGKPFKLSTEIVAVKDASNRFCAGIKVISDLDGFKYDSYNRVVNVKDMPGEDMVYLSPDERVLEVYLAGYKPLKIILSETGIQLESKVVWQIELAGEQKLTQIPIGIISNPPGAEVIIDSKSIGSIEQHQVNAGTHQIQLKKNGYEPVIQTIVVDASHTIFKFDLKEIEDVPIQLSTTPEEAVVYIDNVKFGATPLSNFYPSGRYPIRIEKAWYVTFEDYIDIKAPMIRQTFTLQKDFGALTVSSSPQTGLDIYINDEFQNTKTPHTFNRLKSAAYRIYAKSRFYETGVQIITVKRGGVHAVDLTSEENFATLTIKTTEGADVYLNDNKITILTDIRLEPQVAVIRVNKPPKGKPVEERIVLKKQENRTVELAPQIPVGTIQVAVVPFEANIILKGDAGEHYSANQTSMFKDIPAGTYEIEVDQEGYKTYKNTKVLHEGETVKEVVTLEAGSDVPEGFVLVEGGTFQMGSNNGDVDEQPLHTVTISSFYLSKTEVTFDQYDAFCNATGRKKPSDNGWGMGNRPVIYVNWHDARAYCKWAGGRLPTEAEWEYAARGGNKSRGYTYSGSNTLEDAGWFFSNSSKKTHPVAQKQPNELGLYDMSGNVWEWCSDRYGSYSSVSQTNPTGPGSGTSRVFRGGSWGGNAGYCRSADRGRRDLDCRRNYLGFRCARTF